ncbi:hypothetical protein HUO13_01210 [Saccharopolyspora erythraea]|nr:hypothetical protein HUO13_01210 [Saccharopolyspora erythraea]
MSEPQTGPTEQRVSWKPDVDHLLGELRRRGWVLFVFGDKKRPEMVGHVFAWSTCADVVLLRSEDDATAYRVPALPDTDVFRPELVSWQYHAPAAWTLRAVLTLESPEHPDAPRAVLRPDRGCFVPSEVRRPLTIRPTSLTGRL